MTPRLALFWCLLPLPSLALPLLDGKSFLYDIGESGVLTQGSLNAYANMYELRINDTLYLGKVVGLSPDGREVRTEVFVEPNTGLEVRRQIYVSKTLNFARFAEILRNPTEADLTANLEVFGKLGSRTQGVVDQGNFLITNAPSLLHYHSQVGHPLAAVHTLNGNQLSWHYPALKIPAKSQVRLIYFVAQTTDVDAAKEVATLIFNNPTALYEDLDSAARQEILNFTPPQPTPQNGFGQVPFLNVGEHRLGVLAENDEWSHARASTPADAYAIHLKKEATVTIRLSAYFNAYLYLFGDEAGQTLLESNDDQDVQGTNAEIVFTALEDKTYYIEVTAHNRRDRGNYTLEVIEGSVNHPPRAYNFEFPTYPSVAPAEVTFTDFSVDSDGKIVEWCWQFGDGSPLTCGDQPTITHTFQKAGQYSVGLTLRDDDGAYAYINQLVSVTTATSEGVILPISNTVTGELASSDGRSQTRSNAFTDRYLVKSSIPGQELVIDMQSTDFASYLYLYDEFNRLIRQAGGHLRYTPVQNGDLLIEATSFQDNTLGRYTLTLDLANNSPIHEVPIEASTGLHNPLQNLFVARLPNSFKPSFFLWNFGDESPVVGSNEAVVSHLYPQAGRFTVSLTAVDLQGQEASGKQEFLIINQALVPVSRFRVTPLFGENPLRAFFTNESFSSLPGDELRYVWQFGDGEVSTDLHPAHTFTQEGTYPVILQVYSKLNQQSASYSVPISVIDRDSGKIPVTGVTRLRPQVMMAGFDPMLVDLLDTDVKVMAVVRPGAAPIQTVRVMQNGSDFTLVMQQVATYSNGDQRYETVLTLTKGLLPVATYANIFGDKPSQFRIQAIDQAGQFHAYPNLEIGHNSPLSNSVTSLNMQPLRQVGVRRSFPQVLAAGFDPALVDVTDTQLLIKAIVREGLFPIQSVTLQGELPMRLQEILPNGDKLYVVNYTYPQESLEINTWGNLFGDQPTQFKITVVDQGHQMHSFPELKVGNFPQQ